jgi:hypothetical protein
MLYFVNVVHHFSFGVSNSDFVIKPFFDDYKDVSIYSRGQDTTTRFKEIFAEIRAATKKAYTKRSLGDNQVETSAVYIIARFHAGSTNLEPRDLLDLPQKLA